MGLFAFPVSVPHGILLKEGWSSDCPKWKVGPVFCVSHSIVVPLPRGTLRGGKAGPPSPRLSPVLISRGPRRDEGQLITSSFGSDSWASLPCYVLQGSYMGAPTNHFPTSRPQKETEERGLGARVAWSCAPRPAHLQVLSPQFQVTF